MRRCGAFWPLSSEADRAAIRALLRGMPPPGIIFAPRRRPPVLVRLQTAAHIRLTSTVQEEQGAMAPCDRARIVRFTVCEQVEAVFLRFAHRRRGIFLLCCNIIFPPVVVLWLPHGRTSEVLFR